MARDNKLIQLYLTNQCNSVCKTCHMWKNKEIEELNPEYVYENICEKFPTADYVFGGGEITLYSGLSKLLDLCNKNNINYTCLTNCVNYEDSERLVTEYNAPNITISCDGTKHDEIRRIKGNLSNILKFVYKYRGKTNLKLSYTYSRFNENSFEEDMDFFKRMGFDKIYFCLAQDMDLLKAGKTVVADNFKKILKYKNMLYDKDVKFIDRMLSNSKVDCDSTKSVYTVYTNGDVVMCQSFMSRHIHGNIYCTPFKEIIDMWEMGSNKCPTCIYDEKCNLLCQRRYD